MKKVNLDNLPRYEKGKNKGNINWITSIGEFVPFEYDGINGLIEIVDYSKNYVTISYDGKTMALLTSSLSQCRIGRLLGVIKSFSHDIGDYLDESHTILVTEQLRDKDGRRKYKYICQNCNNSGCTYESNIGKVKQICSVCSGKKLKIGINDAYTRNPECVDRFPGGKEEMEQYFPSSHTKINPRCPICGQIKNIKSSVYNIISHGVACECIGGKSYPHRFVKFFLDQNNIDYVEEYYPAYFVSVEGLRRRRFDFYIKQLNIIIEVDGEIGHGKKNPFGNFDNPYFGKDIDDAKDKCAKEHGQTVIRINADKRDLEYMKNQLVDALTQYFSFDSINWANIHECALKSIIKDVCLYYNMNPEKTLKDIGIQYNITPTTVTKYLKYGHELGWCVYDANKNKLRGQENIRPNHSKAVFCFELSTGNKYSYPSAVIAERCTGVKASYINRCCNGSRKSSGGFYWSYQ